MDASLDIGMIATISLGIFFGYCLICLFIHFSAWLKDKY